MRTFRGAPWAAWSLAGVLAGGAGLATSYFLAMAMTLRDSPVLAVAELIIRLTPGALVEKAISTVGHRDKPLLVIGVLVVTGCCSRGPAGCAARSWWRPLLVYVGLAAVGAYAVADQRGAGFVDQVPVAVGLRHLGRAPGGADRAAARGPRAAAAPRARRTPTRRTAGRRAGPPGSRRGFLLGGRLVAGVSVAVGLAGRVVGKGRRQVEESRRLLRLPRVTAPVVPKHATLGLEGLSPWETSAADFYLIDTAIVVPAIAARQLDAAHPRHGRPRAGDQLPRPARPAAHRGLDHPQLRVQPGRRRR